MFRYKNPERAHHSGAPVLSIAHLSSSLMLNLFFIEEEEEVTDSERRLQGSRVCACTNCSSIY